MDSARVFPPFASLPCLSGKKACIFDMDGTLLDSMEYWRMCPDEVLRGEMTFEQFMKRQYDTVIRPKPNAVEFLQYLSATGIPFCIATHTKRELAADLLQRLGVDRLLAFYVDAFELQTSKAREGRIYDECARRLGFGKEDIAVFEDHLPAIRTAVREGYHVIGVADAVSASDEAEIRSLCDGFLERYPDPSELPSV